MNKRIMLVAASAVLALVGVGSVYAYAHTAGKNSSTPAAAGGTTVLVASKRVAAGTTWADAVSGHYLTTEKMPAGDVPAEALSSISGAAVGSTAVAQSDIAPGQTVLRSSFGTAVAKTGVLSIPKGDMALSVQLPANANVAGFVGAGAQVTIFVTGTKGSSSQNSLTATLVPRASVLATSSSTTDSVTGSSSTSANSAASVLVTLALSQRDAERVIEAQHAGSLYLGLLSASSTVTGNDQGVDNGYSVSPAHLIVK